ncbi:hypothetical protein KUM39_00975 [Streptomyces sp. J2-1]|uniref:Rv1733c family protein n=1 Tax=Streptomyces corallincola TaxID=2851888 RepID=UPI001C380C78|nr:hypothetical protein [Streptomyces corallincola]MBV2352942.1 hypothetical protein [Streptomyces corallincola]
MRTRIHGWRWRRNPLRRRSDVIDAWAVLVVAVLLTVAVPLAGVIAGLLAHDSARALAERQRADLHPTRAVVVADPPGRPTHVEGEQRRPSRAEVRWTEPRGAVRTATVAVPVGTGPGDTVTVWRDRLGRAVAPPPSDTAVWQHTLTLGVCASAATAGVVLLGHALRRRVALRHRLAEWEQEWARTGPEWTRPKT